MCLSLFNAPEGGYAERERKLCQKIIFLSLLKVSLPTTQNAAVLSGI